MSSCEESRTMSEPKLTSSFSVWTARVSRVYDSSDKLKSHVIPFHQLLHYGREKNSWTLLLNFQAQHSKWCYNRPTCYWQTDMMKKNKCMIIFSQKRFYTKCECDISYGRKFVCTLCTAEFDNNMQILSFHEGRVCEKIDKVFQRFQLMIQMLRSSSKFWTRDNGCNTQLQYICWSDSLCKQNLDFLMDCKLGLSDGLSKELNKQPFVT